MQVARGPQIDLESLTDVEILRAKIAIERVLSSDDQQILSHVEEVDLEDDGDELHSAAETATLDPDLQNIALKVVARASKQKAADDYDGMQQTRPGTSQQESSGGSALVTVCVKWVPHPEDEVMLGRPQQSWSFTVKRHESLKQLFLQISDKAHVLAEDLVLMRGGKQVFTSVSPAGLGVWGQLDLEACDRITFEALRQRFRSVTPAQQEANDPQSDREASAPLSEASVEPDGSDKFKLVLRAPGTKEITLSVRSTTTCGKIVRAFLAVIAKHGGKVPASPRKAAQVRLCIDGEKQHPDTPISECDLEDGDMVEVVGM
ncbi:hypothetical protein K439DRAFT_857466 [Ramaria rubella]|nr:hypothetical protein K439DRAFT_857466 [Ramaria rubella]